MSALAIAHKKLKGDLNNSYQYNSSETTLYWDEWDKTYTTYYGRMSRETLIYIATVEEFNNFKGDNVEVYTQEMADNGALPSVGMECVGTSSRGAIMTSWRKGSITFNSPTYTIFKTNNGIEFCCNHLLGQNFTFKPLTPPIELIDGKAYQFYGTDNRKKLGFYNSARDKFTNNDYSWKASAVTGIQPLTVEVK